MESKLDSTEEREIILSARRETRRETPGAEGEGMEKSSRREAQAARVEERHRWLANWQDGWRNELRVDRQLLVVCQLMTMWCKRLAPRKRRTPRRVVDVRPRMPFKSYIR